jgi:mannitol/fructose-specific phosphotransferase system IIA component (Ntr-type)
MMDTTLQQTNSHNPDTVRPKDLLNIGLDPAVLWNVDREKNIKSHIFITATLKNGYSEHVISKLAEYFGKDEIMKSLKQYRNRISDQLFNTVKNYLDHSQYAA